MWKDKIGSLCLLPFVLMVKLLVRLRYRIEIKGLERLTPDHFSRSGGLLFLPNHPAEIDPVILESILWDKFRPRPLVVEHFYHLKGFRFFMDLVQALPLPTMDTLANKWRAKKVAKQFQAVADALKKGESFLIYPSGRLKVTGLELIGGASFVHNLLEECPNVNVVLVRTTGLWGSQFSKALTGSSPDFGKVLWNCCKILLKNGIFFTPKRKILIEFELPPPDFPYGAPRLEFNKYLENWYNRYPKPGEEPVQLVSYSRWSEVIPAFTPATQVSNSAQELPVSNKIKKEVFVHLSNLSGKAPDQIEWKMHLSQDLGLDSLDIAQLYLFLDEKYQVANLVPGDLVCVGDLLQAAAGYQKERNGVVKEKPAVQSWPSEKKRRLPEIANSNTIQEAFLICADRNGSQVACADAISGILSYRKMKIGALLLSRQIGKMPGEHIGIMLPSSAGAYLVILSVLLAGKIPVMLNWTAGVRALDHAADLTNLESVLTSAKFLDRLEDGDLGKIEERFYLLEELREKINWKEKIKALFLSLLRAKTLMKRLALDSLKPSSTAVVLFTSGTESLPKGVPLSHSNILSNQRACLEIAELSESDILYGVLPPFHSFGFSITGLLALLAGIRICYAPDPTDSHRLAKDIAGWKPTLFCCAPSFIKGLFRVAKPADLRSIRLIVAGAEKATQDLFDYVKTHLPLSQLLEGYGITECSPVVTICRPNTPHVGVGMPLPGVELAILDGTGKEFLPHDQEGEICIAGPNVFSGYLKNPRNPFVNVQGRQWYLSGDRGYIDSEGHLILAGRLKRFVKIGGEMVSLGGLEEDLIRLATENKWTSGKEEGPVLAVSAREGEGDKPTIVLFATFSISRDEVNAALKGCGFGRIVKIAEVHVLEQIPLTGTGKTHYRVLDEIKI